MVLSESGLTETVYNDFLIGDDCDVTIVAGCGIHNCGVQNSEHSGIHTFHVGKRSKVRYVERHYGEGDGRGENIMNPTTVVEMDEDSYMEMETTQIKGVDSTVRTTNAKLGPRRHPHHQGEGDDPRQAAGQVRLHCGPGRRGLPHQRDLPFCGQGPVQAGVPGPHQRTMPGATATRSATPSSWTRAWWPPSRRSTANCVDASLVHEAAIGKIAGEQLIKLMTLGLTEKEAEEQIVNGFLK